MRAASPENVYDLIAKPAVQYTSEPRYVSKYRDDIRRSSKRGKSAHKTLGVPNVSLDPPEQYLRKRSSSGPKKPAIHHEHYRRPDYPRKLPDWQPIRASDQEKRNSSINSIDFKKRNIDEAINRRPTKSQQYYVDDRHGNAQPLRPSGLLPLYRNSKNNGQISGDVSPMIVAHSETRRKSNPRRSTEVEPDETKSRKKHENRNMKKDNDKLRGSVKHENPKRRETAITQRENDKLRESIKQENSKRRETVKPQRDNDESRENAKIQRSRRQTTRMDEKFHEKEKLDDNYEKKDDRRLERKILKMENNHESGSTASTVRNDYQQSRCRYVTEDERAELLYGMKSKWDEMMKQFQCLPFLTDTPPKAKRKAKMEMDLLKLEKDIETIERHPYIYVYSDPED